MLSKTFFSENERVTNTSDAVWPLDCQLKDFPKKNSKRPDIAQGGSRSSLEDFRCHPADWKFSGFHFHFFFVVKTSREAEIRNLGHEVIWN